MEFKLFDSELKVMDILWKEGDTSAKEIAEKLNEQVGWSKTTTYTVIKKCIDKGAVGRSEPGFICRALISRKEVQEAETNELIDKMYDGSSDKLIAALLGSKRLTAEEIQSLKKLVEEGVLRLEAADGNLKNKRVCLTEAGEAFLRRTVDRVFGVESAAAARLTEEERSALVALSQKLLDAFRAETEAFLQTAAIGD